MATRIRKSFACQSVILSLPRYLRYIYYAMAMKVPSYLFTRSIIFKVNTNL